MIKMHRNFFWEGFPQIPGMLNSLVLGFDVHLHQQPRSTSTQSMASNRSCVPIHTAGALLSFKIPNPGATEIHPTFLLPRKKLTWQKTRCNLWWFIDSLTCFSSGRTNLWSANMKLFGQFRQGFPSQPTTLKLDGKVNCLYWEWVCSSWKIQDFHTTTLMNKLIGNVNQTATQPWVSHGISDRLKWYPALSRHHFKLWYPTMSFYLYTNNWESDNLFFAKRSCVDFFESKWGGKKTPRTFAWPFFCYRFFFFLIVLQGIVITVTNIIDLVLQTIFCMTSLPNSITSNIISRGRRQQSRRRQRCSRRQRQRQLRGSEVPRAGLGEEDFFC